MTATQKVAVTDILQMYSEVANVTFTLVDESATEGTLRFAQSGGRRFARSFSWSVATERLVNAIFVVINPELFQLSLQVDCVPD